MTNYNLVQISEKRTYILLNFNFYMDTSGIDFWILEVVRIRNVSSSGTTLEWIGRRFQNNH